MDDTIKLFVANLGLCGAILGIAFWWFGRYIDRRLSLYFTSIEARTQSELSLVSDLRKVRLQKTLDVLERLQKSTSVCRNSLHSIQKHWSEEASKEFSEQHEQLLDFLYSAQLLISPNTYDRLHGYKRLLDQVIIITNEHAPAESKETLITELRSIFTEVDIIYPKVCAAIRNDFNRIQSLGIRK